MSASRLLSLAVVAVTAMPLAAQDSTRKDLAGDPLPEGALARMGSIRLRSETSISAISFSPDGKSLVTAGYSSKITFWDIATGRPARTISVAGNSVNGLEFSRDGKVLAVACDNSTIRLLDPSSGAEKRLIQDPLNRYSTISMSLSPDGSLVSMTHRYNRQILIWDAQTGALKHRISNVGTHNAPPVAFTPDSKHFVSLWTDGKLHLVETASGKSVRCLEPVVTGNVSMYSTRIQALTLSHHGKQVIFQPSTDRIFRAVDLASGKEVRRWARTAGSQYLHARSMALTPNDRFLVENAGDNAIRVWGLASGKMLRELTVAGSPLSTLALSRDGKLAAGASGHAIFLWDIGEAKQLHGGIGHQAVVTRVAFTPDGNTLISLGGTMRGWNPNTGQQLHLTRPYSGYGVSPLIPHPNSKSVRWVGSDRALYEWRIGPDNPVKLTNPRTTPYYSNQVVSPDGKMLAGVNASDRKLRLLHLLENRPDRDLTIVSNPYSNTLVFSPDGQMLALASSTDRVVTLFDVKTAAEVRKLMPIAGTSNSPVIAFAPDGRSLLKFDGEFRVIETATGGERMRLPRDGVVSFSQLAWSDNGRLVARALYDGMVSVHDTFTGRELFRRNTGQGAVGALAFSRDGRKLATGGANTTIMVWSLPMLETPRPALDETTAWRDLEDNDSGRAFRAIAHLCSHPSEAIRLFKVRLKPRPPVDAKRIDSLIRDLDDDAYAVREKASEELAEIGHLAEEALKKATKSSSLEVRRRADHLLRKIKGAANIAPDRLRARRAVEVLERIGSPAAALVLRNMLKMKLDANLEASIRDSLGRLGQ
jgi:WD40 repeat protein